MALFFREDHAANSPETWTVRKAHAGRWHLCTKDGQVIDYSSPTKQAAESLKVTGFYVNLYEQERREYATP